MNRLGYIAAACLVFSGGCSDEVIGPFLGGTLVMGGDGGATANEDSSSGDPEANSSTGDRQPTWTEGCFSDDFEDGVLDESLWNTWIRGDAQFNEAAGRMKFDPPTFGLRDVGLVTSFRYVLPFEYASTAMEIVTPPDPTQPIVMFLQVGGDEAGLSISISEGELTVYGWNAMGVRPFEEVYPEFGNARWLGIRAEGSLVNFEVSDDGETWTTVVTHESPGDFSLSSPLIMVQTYGDVPEPTGVSIDNFETCVD